MAECHAIHGTFGTSTIRMRRSQVKERMSLLSLTHIWRRLIPGILALLFFCSPGVSLAADFLPVDQIRPGMHGIAKTVVAGNSIDEFGVEVLGIMKDKGPSGDLILVRVYGDLVDKTGIAQGMSGSPVYIDGKLIGAIAYGWSLTDHKVGMVTPIGDMLKLWELPVTVKQQTAERQTVEEQAAEQQPQEEQPSADKEKEQQELKPVATPIMAAGFTANALTLLKEKLAPFSLVPYGVGTVPGGISNIPLQPGSAVGVELVRGDVSLGALGTVTYVEGDKVLAFGHPFLKKGQANYFMTNAHVFTTLAGLENAFKVGVTGEAVGMINQDRGAGVGGLAGRYPAIIPVRILVKDNSTGASRDAAVQVIQDDQLSPILAAATVFNVIDKTLDRAGSGTARLSFEISGRHMPVETMKRDNMFYTAGSIAELAVSELHEALSVLAGNQYNQVDIMDVKVDVTIDSDRKTAAITEARAGKAEVRPGEQVDIIVKLKPFRGEPVSRTVSFTVPNNQPAGALTLEVRGGGYVPLFNILANQGLAAETVKPRRNKQSFDKMIQDLVSRDRNNDLVVEIMDLNFEDFTGENAVQKQTKSKQTAKSLEPQLPQFAKPKNKSIADGSDADKPKKSYLTTDYIVEGDTQVVLQVVGNNKK